MSEESKAIEPKAETSVSNIDQELIRQAQQESGVSNMPSIPFIPIIKVDNKKIEKEIDGETQEVLPPPSFVLSERTDEKDENDKYIYENSKMGEEFNAVVLKIRYQVSNKYNPKLKIEDMWRSREFNNFNSDVIIGDGYKAKWKQFKIDYADSYNLVMIVYVLLGEKVYRLNLTGMSRSNMWDYMKSFGNNDHMMFHSTKFTCTREKNDTGITFNCAKMSVNGSINVVPSEMLDKAKELSNMLQQIQDYFDDKSEPEVEQVNNNEIKIEDIPFD